MIDREMLDNLARNIERHAFQRGYVSAFTLAAYPVPSEAELTLHITRECDGLVYGNAEVGTEEAFQACVEALDGRVDYIVYDVDLLFRPTSDGAGIHAPDKSVILPYRDLDVWVASVRYTLMALDRDLQSKKVTIVGSGSRYEPLGYRLAIDLEGYFADIALEGILSKEQPDNPFNGADVIIGTAIYKQVITVAQIEQTGTQPLLIDAGIGTLTPDAAEYARQRGLQMIRVDNRAAMAGTLFSLIQSHDLVTRVMGSGEIEGVPVVAGGVVGPPGTVIVDSIDRPVQVIGLADGTGKVRYAPETEEERKRLRRVADALEREEANG